ncbi:DUF4625 domain-containing protein [Leeuwenhoekiella aestuarii]|uniref:DUF4625 domain-containing protein n=1 Tax=Leeuwenhoekiella aestuarii TaxID=2249426 RepID=UPI000FFE6439|nr:DUF4625 domain-containing protein [Leeuwenhoekiella aestuarii]
MRRIIIATVAFIALLTSACSSDSDTTTDEIKPTITINYAEGFPQACATLKRGEIYTFKAKITDNVALAAYSLNLHHNFDHHTHDDQGAQCDLEEIKQAINPLIYMENFSLSGQTEYEIEISVSIPNDIDTGDYHCSYSVTDETGWQSRTSSDIKIIE